MAPGETLRSANISDSILQASNITKDFGGLRALNEVSFGVQQGQVKGIIGPNGAGKTTLFNVLSGVLPATEGEIRFKDRIINKLKPYQIAEVGIARTFQNVRLFSEMTVLENVMVGLHCRTGSSILSAGLRLPRIRKEEKKIFDASMEFLAFVGLEKKAYIRSSKLPIGEQKILEIARALALRPSLLMLDEPAAGLNDVESESLKGLVGKIRDEGKTVLLVEHDMDLVMGICDEILVLNFGSTIAEGAPEEIKRDKLVIKAYLGDDEND